jgi:hypothetical protein
MTYIDTATPATLLVLDIEPLTPLPDSPGDVATAFNEARNLGEDRNVPTPDECAMTDLATSVGTAIPDRDKEARAQRSDLRFGPIITALQRTESASTLRHGNEYALSDRLLYRLPKGKSPDSARPRLCVPINLIPTLFDFYHNSPSGGHLTASGLMVGYGYCISGRQWAMISSKHVNSATGANPHGLAA